MSLEDDFPFEFSPPSAEPAEHLEQGHFVFDTNVLLQLYDVNESARKSFLKVLDKLEGRLFLPHQVAYEFFQNNKGRHRSEHDKAVDGLKAAKDSVTKLLGLLSDDTNVEVEPIRNIAKQLSTRLEQAKESRPEKLAVDERDPVVEALKARFNDCTGTRPTTDELLETLARGEKRVHSKFPPGLEDYYDRKKNADRRRRLGDVLIWFEMLAFAQKKDLKSLIFVTNDMKDGDWFRGYKPHPFLWHEMAKRNTEFWAYEFREFRKSATNHFDINLSEDDEEQWRESAKKTELNELTEAEDRETNEGIDVEGKTLGEILVDHFSEQAARRREGKVGKSLLKSIVDGVDS
jgi:predicted nucleic acid-binding protein